MTFLLKIGVCIFSNIKLNITVRFLHLRIFLDGYRSQNVPNKSIIDQSLSPTFETLLIKGVCKRTWTLNFQICKDSSKSLDEQKSLNHYMNLFGSNGKFVIQTLFWRSRVATWQRFFMILIFIQDNDKGDLTLPFGKWFLFLLTQISSYNDLKTFIHPIIYN